MERDDLLRQLAATALEEEAAEAEHLDGRWNALAAGTLSPAEERALRAEAAETPEGRAALAAFTPLSDEGRARIAAQVRGSLRPAAMAEEPPERSLLPPPPASRRPRGLAWGLAGAGLAAALALLVWLPRFPAEPLDFTATLRGTTAAARSPGGEPGAAEGPGQVPTVTLGNRLELELRPRAGEAGPVEATAFTVQGERILPWPSPETDAVTGAARFTGTAGEEIPLSPGAAALVAAVGRRGALPQAGELLDRLAGETEAQGKGWQAWRYAVVVEGGPEGP